MIAYICCVIAFIGGILLAFNSEGELFISALLIISASLLTFLGVSFRKK